MTKAVELSTSILSRMFNDGLGKTVHFILQLLQPIDQRLSLLRRHFGTLMGNVGRNIAIDDQDFSLCHGMLNKGLFLQPVTGIQQGGQFGMYIIQTTKLTVEIMPYFLAEKSLAITGESQKLDIKALGPEIVDQPTGLGVFSRNRLSLQSR